MKRIWLLVVFLFLLLGCTANQSEKNLSSASVYDTDLKCTIKLGMTKSEVEGLLGKRIGGPGGQYNLDCRLHIEYDADDKVNQIYAISATIELDSRYKFMNEITMLSTPEEVKQACGDPTNEVIYKNIHGYTYRFDSFVLEVVFNNGEVDGIFLYDLEYFDSYDSLEYSAV